MKFHYFKVDLTVFLIILLILFFTLFCSDLFPFLTVFLIKYRFYFLVFTLMSIIYLYSPFPKREKQTLKSFFFCSIIPLLFCLVTTFSINLLLSSIASYTGIQNKQIFNYPATASSWAKILIQFLFMAVYEEITFRFYLPDMMKHLVCIKKENKYLKLLCEIFACLLFAFGHFYMGILAVINALLAHIIFRIVYIKTDNILVTTTAHFIYNTISLTLL